MTILGLAESFKMMSWPGATLRSLTANIPKSIKDSYAKFLHNLHSSLQFALFKFGNDIFDSLETMLFSAT